MKLLEAKASCSTDSPSSLLTNALINSSVLLTPESKSGEPMDVDDNIRVSICRARVESPRSRCSPTTTTSDPTPSQTTWSPTTPYTPTPSSPYIFTTTPPKLHPTVSLQPHPYPTPQFHYNPTPQFHYNPTPTAPHSFTTIPPLNTSLAMRSMRRSLRIFSQHTKNRQCTQWTSSLASRKRNRSIW